MTSPIFVHSMRSPFDPKRSTDLVPWHRGVTLAEMRPEGFDDLGAGDMIVTVNAEIEHDLMRVVAPGQHVCFARRQHGLDPVTLTFLGAQTVFTVPGWLGAVAVAVGNLALSYVVGQLLAPPKPPKQRSDIDSPTYQWSGLRANRSEGLPIPIIYGEIRFAGTVIAEYLSFSVFQVQTVYNGLVLLGHGPIHSVGGVESDTTAPLLAGSLPDEMLIDGNSADNFSGVKVEVRLGTLQQGPTTQFQRVPTNYPALAFELNAPKSGVTSGAVLTDPIITDTTYSNPTVSGAHFDAYGRTTQMDGTADSCSLIVTFPDGLVRIDGTGNLQLHTVRFAVRYIELDGTGTPITTGGPDGDGYVRLPPLSPVVAAKTGSFTAGLDFSFFDPQTYAYGTFGEALSLGSATETATKASPSMPGLNPGAAMSYTWMGWLGFSPLTTDNWPATNGERAIFGFTNGQRGVVVKIVTQVVAGVAPYVAHYVEVEHGNGTNFTKAVGQANGPQTQLANGYSSAANGWRHVAVTFNAPDATLRVYLNAELVFTVSAPSTPAVPVVSGSSFQYIGLGTSTPGFLLDETRFYSRALSGGEIGSDFNDGSGTYGQPGDATLQAGYHHDSTADYNGNGNTLALAGGANTTTGNKGRVIATAPTSTLKRGRFQIELVRNNNDGTHERVIDKAVWSGLTTFIDDALSYPGSALIGTRVAASEQLSGSVPDISYRVKGKVCPAWNSTTETFTQAWSSNPAWVVLDILLNKDYGLGDFYEVGDIDLPSFAAWAAYCDELVDNKRQKVTVGTGSAEVELYYGQDPATFGYIVAITDTNATELLSVEKYTKLGKPKVGDYIAFSGVPISGTESPTNTNVNVTDGAEGYTSGGTGDPSFTGGLLVVRSEQFGTGEWKLFCAWPDADVTRPWTANTFLSAHTSLAGTVRRQERRLACNGVLDATQSAWDGLLQVAACGRGAPVRVGSKIRVKFDGPRTPVDIVSIASIVADSFVLEYTGAAAKPNVMELEILDEALDYERSIARVEHPSVQSPETFEGYRVESQFLWGVTSRAQAMRFGLWQLNLFNTVTRQGSFRLGPDGLPYEPGDLVVLDHDLLHGSTGGRVQSDAPDASHITLDTDVNLTGAGTWQIKVRRTSTGENATAVIDTSTHVPPLIIPAGTEITLSTPLPFVASTDDPFIFTLDGADLTVQITYTTLAPNLEREIRWMEYDASIYDDNTFDDIEAFTYSGTPPITQRTIPNVPTAVNRPRFIASSSGGGDSAQVVLSWQHDETTVQAVAATELYYRVVNSVEVDGIDTRSAPWTHLATVPSHGDTWRGAAPFAHGDRVDFAARPVNAEGRGYSIDACSFGVSIYTPGVARPAAPASVAARSDGAHAVYSVLPPSDRSGLDRSLTAVVRRGGWILGQPVCEFGISETSSSPTRDWAGGEANSYGEADPALNAAYVTPSGVRSSLVSATFAPGTAALTLAHYSAEAFAWDPNWLHTGFIPAPTLTDCVATADWSGRKYLEFTGSALTASYETVLGPALSGRRPRECYVEAFFEGFQVDPTPVDALWPAGIGAPESDHWTLEGSTLDGATRCTVKLQVSIDGTASWQDYRPGVYVGKLFYFKLVMTRPSTDWNVRIYRMGTRARRVGFVPPAGRRSDVQNALEREVFNV